MLKLPFIESKPRILTISLRYKYLLSCNSILSLQWLLKLVQGSIKVEWQDELSLSQEKITKLKISRRTTIQGVIFVVVAGCGAFLFALMSAKEPDYYLVRVVGLVGVIAGIPCVLSDIITVAMEQDRRRAQSQLRQTAIAPTEELVGACSWWYVVASFLATTFYTVLRFLFAITLDDQYEKVGYILLPIFATCFVMATVLRPKDEGTLSQDSTSPIFFFVIVREPIAALGSLRQGNYLGGLLALMIRTPM